MCLVNEQSGRRGSTDRETCYGKMATYWFDNGILVSFSKSPKQTIENIAANSDLVIRFRCS